MEAILPIVTQVLSLIPGLVAAGVEIVSLVESTVKALQSGSANPTDDVWQAVDAQIAANTAKLNADPA
ncbi:MAG: hypothetical protein J0H44_15625 [Alphaproteobacteria bacterium]|nr:hypothetical protein [Alphaproteobacteria bacterium]